MNAAQVMTSKVVTVEPATPLREVARLFVRHGISGAPVVDRAGAVIGMVSESDLLQREELSRDQQASWWLEMIAEGEALAPEFVTYVRASEGCAREVMTREVIAVGEATSVAEIAALMLRHRIKRVPVLRDGRLVGIVSRADLIETLAHPEERRPFHQPRR